MSKWLLIDGYNLAFRCHFAMPDMARQPDGFPTGVLFGWIKSVWRLQDQEQPAGTIVFFDLGGSQDRLALHPEYKAQRAETPEALERQVEPLKKLTRLLGLGLVEQHGVESDDLLASRAVALAAAGDEALIVSSDKDFAQLVGERIRILLPPPSANPKLGWRVLDDAGVKEKFGVPPSQIADYLALIGDSSDNIPGLDGVGPKTASKWLAQYGSVDGVLAAAATIEPERFREQVAASADKLRLNQRLTRLNLSLAEGPVPAAALDYAGLTAFLEEFGLKGTLVEARRRYEQVSLF